MNKSDIVSRVAAQSSLSRAAADRVVNAVFTAIGDGLAQDEAVAIAGFGTFSIKQRPARSGRNPRCQGRRETRPKGGAKHCHRGRRGEMVRGGRDEAGGGVSRKRREGVARPQFPAGGDAQIRS